MKSPLERLFDDVMNAPNVVPCAIGTINPPAPTGEDCFISFAGRRLCLTLASMIELHAGLGDYIEMRKVREVPPEPTQQECVFCGKIDTSEHMLEMGNGTWMHEEPCTSTSADDLVRYDRL